MSLQKLARRVQRRYGADITGLVGGNLRGATFRFGNTNVGETTGQQVTFSRDWWNQADRRDRRGAIIHELTHVATRNQGLGGDDPNKAWADNGIETGADAVRLALVGKHGINPDSLPGAQRIARQSGWLGDNMGTGNGGPPNGNVRRKRNTLANSQYPQGYQAPVSQGSSSQSAATLAQSRYTYLAQLAALRQQVQTGRADKVDAFAAARTQRVGDTAAAANAAADRGGFGSSIDYQGRAGAVAQEGLNRQAAISALTQTKLGAQTGALDARSSYFQTQAQVAAAMAAEREANTISAFADNTFDARSLSWADIRDRIANMKTGHEPRKRRGTGAEPAGAPSYAPSTPDPGSYTPWGKPLY